MNFKKTKSASQSAIKKSLSQFVTITVNISTCAFRALRGSCIESRTPKHENICKSCSQFQKTSYQVMSWSKPLLNPIINDLLHDLSMLARMDRDGWRPCQRMRIYSHCPRLVVAQHIFIDFLLLMSGPEILLGCVKQDESKRFELALTLVSNNPALVFIKS